MEQLFPSPFLPLNRFILLLVICFTFSSLNAQTTPISGTINQIATAVKDFNALTNSVVVDDPTNFHINDTVLLIKMQGVNIEETNTLGFGTIGNQNGVGLYEIATICSVLGNSVSFFNQIQNDYAPSGVFTGKMQMIKVPHYAGNVNVNGLLTAPAWNGSTGGVLAFMATGTVTLNSNIDMSGKGFRGGDSLNSAYNCIPTSDGLTNTDNSTDFYYTLESGEGAHKGEGIAEYILGKEAGVGNQANGGGGGNNYNAGGGGGGNYGIGGNGGTRQATASDPSDICRGLFPGEPGTALLNMGYSLLDNRVFMGGGGGAGHADDGEGKAGGNGGGIIIIIANRLRNGHPLNPFTIRSNGEDGDNSGDDGGAGGGAGGVVLLEYQVGDSRGFNIEARGGAGGGASHNGTNCLGPGGGGGGGAIWTFNPLGATVTTDVSGGQFGLTAATSGCGFGGIVRNGSSSGHNGAVMTGLTVPVSVTPFISCVLAAELFDFQATPFNDKVVLDWETRSEHNHASFIVERSTDGQSFEVLNEVEAMGNELDGKKYSWTDFKPVVGTAYYRLKQMDKLGNFTYSPQVEIKISGADKLELNAYPNPSRSGEKLTVEVNAPISAYAHIKLINLLGEEVYQEKIEVSRGKNKLDLELPKLGQGTYILSVKMHQHFRQHKVVIW